MMIMSYAKKIAPYFLAIGLVGSLFGCKETRKELSEILHEDAIVTNMEHHNSYVQLMPMFYEKTITYITMHYREKKQNHFQWKNKL